jgi:hypothetical protein
MVWEEGRGREKEEEKNQEEIRGEEGADSKESQRKSAVKCAIQVREGLRKQGEQAVSGEGIL